MGERGLNLVSLDAAWRFAQGIIRGRMAPKGITEPGAVVAIIEAGMELGLPPMFALSNLTFINGRLGIMGDAAKALIRTKKKLREGTSITVRYEGTGEDLAAVVTSHRADEMEPVSTTFGVADAKKAKLWGKAGPWSEYPKRMLYYRALGFHVRDQYPDVLMGTVLREELDDYPEDAYRGPKGHAERDVTPKAAEPDPLLSGTWQPTPSPTAGPPAQPSQPSEAETVAFEPEPPTEEPFALEPPPDCDHPDGFSRMGEEGPLTCVHCGEVRD
jgi:hypothetical protein